MLASLLITPSRMVQIAGFSSAGSSSTSFNLTEEVSVLVTGSVNFGAGRVNANASEAILDSELGYVDLHNVTNLTDVSEERPYNGHVNFIYDDTLGVSIMYGTETTAPDFPSPDFNVQTWQFNYSNRQWTNLIITHHPNAFEGHSMAYDKSIGAIILFGGTNGTYLNETWKFNSSGDWEQLFPPTSPLPTGDAPMAFDSKRNVTVLCSGSETWEYNASANTWTNRTSGTHPTQALYSAMAYDAGRNVTVFFGDYGSNYLNETWEYDGNSWTNVTPSLSGESPPAQRSLGAMVYDSLRKKIVLVGGYLPAIPYASNKVFEYNGTGWVNKSSLHYIMYPYAAFDTSINKTLISYGYYITPGYSQLYLNETWEYDVAEEDFNSSAAINGSWYFQRGFITIENDGTDNISINYTSNKNAGQFIGGTSPSFRIKGVAAESGACSDLNTTYAEVPNSSETPNVLCPLLQYMNPADNFKVPSRLVVPSNVGAGAKNATITFSAAKVS